MNATAHLPGPLAMAYGDPKNIQGGFDEVKLLGWNIPAEHSYLVHPHWRQYEEPGILWYGALGLIYFVLMIVSFIGNGVVIGIFAVSKPLRTPSNLFVVNQALFDILMMMEMPMLIINSFIRRPIGWQTGCDVYAMLGAVSGMGSAINNAAIAFDRYRTIAFPLDGRLGMKQVIALVTLTWLWATPFSVLPLFRIWNQYIPEGFLTTCSFDYLTEGDNTQMFVISIFAWAYCFPLLLIVVFYWQLFGHVSRHEQMLRAQAKKMNVKSLQANTDESQESVEIRIAKLAFTIFFLFLCSWTPYAIVALVGAFGNKAVLTPVVTMVPAVAAKVVSCIDPWLYAINHPRYRKEIQERCPWLLGAPPPPKNKSDGASATSERTVVSKDDAQA